MADSFAGYIWVGIYYLFELGVYFCRLSWLSSFHWEIILMGFPLYVTCVVFLFLEAFNTLSFFCIFSVLTVLSCGGFFSDLVFGDRCASCTCIFPWFEKFSFMIFLKVWFMLLMQDFFLLCLQFEVLVFVVYHSPCMFFSCDCFPLCVCVWSNSSTLSQALLFHLQLDPFPEFSIEFFNFIFTSLELSSIFLSLYWIHF